MHSERLGLRSPFFDLVLASPFFMSNFNPSMVGVNGNISRMTRSCVTTNPLARASPEAATIVGSAASGASFAVRARMRCFPDSSP